MWEPAISGMGNAHNCAPKLQAYPPIFSLTPKASGSTWLQSCEVHYRNVGGVGGFKSIALRKFTKEIKTKFDDDCEFTIVLCSDTDVFDFASKPPIKWGEIKKELKANGAGNIIHIQAKRSIEDWFLYDIEGILGFLRLGKNTKVSGKNGYDKLQRLYKQANKVYYKGIKSNGMIGRLDIEKIADAVKDQLNPLYKALGVDKN